jgi:hypothetical protein
MQPGPVARGSNQLLPAHPRRHLGIFSEKAQLVPHFYRQEHAWVRCLQRHHLLLQRSVLGRLLALGVAGTATAARAGAACCSCWGVRVLLQRALQQRVSVAGGGARAQRCHKLGLRGCKRGGVALRGDGCLC